MPREFGVSLRSPSQLCDDRRCFFAALRINSPKSVLRLKLRIAIATPNAEKTHHEGHEVFDNHDSELCALRVLRVDANFRASTEIRIMAWPLHLN